MFQVLDMTNNAVTQKENYRETVRQNIPSLVYLDKIPFVEVSAETKMDLMRSEYRPVNNEVMRQNLNRTVCDVSLGPSGWNRDHLELRPSSAVHPLSHISTGRRLMTLEGIKPKYDVSVGEPVCGNIITKARKPKKLKTAWGDSCSSSSFSSSDSSTQGTPINKPNTTVGSNESCEELLECARLWREKSKESRETFNK